MPGWSEESAQDGSTAHCLTAGRAPALTWRNSFRGDPAELAQLRHWLENLLPACAARDDLEAVAHELGLNAVIHTASGQGGWFSVEMTLWAAAMRVAVGDGGAPRGPRVVVDPGSEHGRGLLLVRGLSTRMGVYGDENGRVVWADIPWAADGTFLPRPTAASSRSTG